jgi:hypothetical protein
MQHTPVKRNANTLASSSHHTRNDSHATAQIRSVIWHNLNEQITSLNHCPIFLRHFANFKSINAVWRAVMRSRCEGDFASANKQIDWVANIKVSVKSMLCNVTLRCKLWLQRHSLELSFGISPYFCALLSAAALLYWRIVACCLFRYSDCRLLWIVEQSMEQLFDGLLTSSWCRSGIRRWCCWSSWSRNWSLSCCSSSRSCSSTTWTRSANSWCDWTSLWCCSTSATTLCMNDTGLTWCSRWWLLHCCCNCVWDCGVWFSAAFDVAGVIEMAMLNCQNLLQISIVWRIIDYQLQFVVQLMLTLY